MPRTIARGKALVAKLRADPKVRDAEALAAELGRRKHLREAARKAKKEGKKITGKTGKAGKGESGRKKNSTAEPKLAFKIGKLEVFEGDKNNHPGKYANQNHAFAIGEKDGKTKMLFYRPEKASQLGPEYIGGHAMKRGVFDGPPKATGNFSADGSKITKADGSQITKPQTPRVDRWSKDTPELRETLRKAYPEATEYRHGADRKSLSDGRNLDTGQAVPKPAPKPTGDTPAIAALKKQIAERKVKGKSAIPGDIDTDRGPVYKDTPKALASKPHHVLMGTPDGESRPRAIFAKDPVAIRKGSQADMGGLPQQAVAGSFDPKTGLTLHPLGAAALSPDEVRNLVKQAYPNEKRFKYDGKEYKLDGDGGAKAPVSDAMRVPNTKTFEPARGAISAIDKVHDDGDLSQIPVSGGIRQPGLQGQYSIGLRGSSIKLKGKDASHPRMTAVHEIGHALDHQVLGDDRNKFASKQDSEVKPVLEAAQETEAVKKLLDMRTNPDKYETTWKGPISGIEHRYPPDQKHLKYLVSPQEVFARAYAQYIAEKSDDPKMNKELKQSIAENSALHSYPTQWGEEDFSAIRDALDKMFKKKGWLKE